MPIGVPGVDPVGGPPNDRQKISRDVLDAAVAREYPVYPVRREELRFPRGGVAGKMVLQVAALDAST